MAKVRLRTAADADLVSILDYSVVHHGEGAGEAYLRSFEQAFEMLRRHPQAGPLHPIIDPSLRYLSHRSHRIFYDIDGDTVWIVRILHHKMDADRWLNAL